MRSTVCRCVLPALVGWAMASSVVLVYAGENYALLVAVQDYDEKELRPLQFTRADIIDFQKALVESGFKPRNVIVLHDDIEKLVAHYKKLGADYNPTDYLPESARIRKQLELVLNLLQKDDSVVVAFTGHGVQFAKEKKSYFCPRDAKLDDKETLISFDEIYAHLKDCEAARKLLLVDACQNDPQSRIGKARKTVDLESVTRPQSEPVPEGIIALFSCRAGQQSFEHPPLGHGIFFHHVLDGWKGKADLNGDSQLSYLELAQYAERQTSEYAYLKLKVSQKPQLKAEFSGDWVLREYGDGKVITNSIGMKLVRIPAGEYLRGSPASDKDAADDEKPQHRVRITKDFLLGMHEVTRGEFRKFVDSEGYRTDAEKDGKGGYGFDLAKGTFEQKPEYTWKSPGFSQSDEHPVLNVSWNDAMAFCEWLSRKEGKTYRLPTEAEWEYACRAGTTTRWSMSDDENDLRRTANVADASIAAKSSTIKSWAKEWDDGVPFTASVRKFQPNKFGLFDMHGNVWEWCSDWYDEKEYAKHAGEAVQDPQGPRTGSLRVLRGGSWRNRPRDERSSFRLRSTPETRDNRLGFRVAAVPSAKKDEVP